MINFNQNKVRALTATLCLTLFLCLTFLVKTHATIVTTFDSSVQRLLLPITSPTMTAIVNAISFMGGPEMSLAYCLAICLLLYFFHKRYEALWALATVISCNLLNWIVKNIVVRPRPSDRLVNIGGFSFPSGHTFGTALFVFLIFYLFLPHLKNKALKMTLYCLGIGWIIIIALTRIYLHVHYPTDTIASVLLVGFLFEIALILSDRYLKYHKK